MPFPDFLLAGLGNGRGRSVGRVLSRVVLPSLA